jgi:pimeloyl-ACP methyl ester carboxylesterase
MKLCLALAIVSLTFGCARFLPSPTPMQWIRYNALPDHAARCLLVLLPGAADDDTAFFRQGFVDDVKARHLSVDVVSANATLGYYAKGIVWDRLAEDVVEPARARGYEHTWLAGISMGGLGALVYPRLHPGTVDGVMAMAPFLGDVVIDEIGAAGGVDKWQAPAPVEKVNAGNYQRELWRWLKEVTGGAEKGPEIYLGFGTSDRLAPANRLLAGRLPPDHVYMTEGDHDWPPWRQQWGTFLDKSDLSAQCGR